jgi:hypothetical protein
MTKTSEKDIEQITKDVWAFISTQLETHRPMAVAGVMVSQALTIYKSLLTQDEFDSIVDTISDTRDRVQKITPPELQ